MALLGGLHLLPALSLLPLGLLSPPFVLVNAWLTAVGVILPWPRPGRRRLAIVAAVAGVALSALIAAYGVFAMVMRARSAARGGGLLGGLGDR